MTKAGNVPDGAYYSCRNKIAGLVMTKAGNVPDGAYYSR